MNSLLVSRCCSIHWLRASSANEREDEALLSTPRTSGCFVPVVGGISGEGFIVDLSSIIPNPTIQFLRLKNSTTVSTDARFVSNDRVVVLGSNFGVSSPKVEAVYDLPEDLRPGGTSHRMGLAPLAVSPNSLELLVPPGHGQLLVRIGIAVGEEEDSGDSTIVRYPDPIINAAAVLPKWLSQQLTEAQDPVIILPQVKAYVTGLKALPLNRHSDNSTYNVPSGCMSSPTEGGKLLALKGSYLGAGQHALERRVTVGGSCPTRSNVWTPAQLEDSPCECSLVAFDEDIVVFRIPEGQGQDLLIRYEVSVK